MPLKPRALYAAACDECGAIYPDPDTDTDALFRHPTVSPTLRQALTAEGWLAVGKHILCDTHAPAWLDKQAQGLEIDATHDPLFNTEEN